MRRSRRLWGPTVVMTSLALVLAACGGGSGSSTGAGETDPDGTVSVYGTEPQNALVPTNINDLGGTKAIQPMFATLVGFKGADAKPFNLMAESITTTDSKVYDIKIKQGWKFHDGTEVKAHNFIDAWNYGAYAPNGQLNTDFFSNIQGYADVHPEDENAKPATDKMSGLVQKSDYEFQVTLERAVLGVRHQGRLPGVRAAAGLLLQGPQGLRAAPDRQRPAEVRLADAEPGHQAHPQRRLQG